MSYLPAICVVVLIVGVYRLCTLAGYRKARRKLNEDCPDGDYSRAVSEAVRQLIDDGRMVDAIREFRRETGLPLVDAKRIVDAEACSRAEERK